MIHDNTPPGMLPDGTLNIVHPTRSYLFHLYMALLYDNEDGDQCDHVLDWYEWRLAL